MLVYIENFPKTKDDSYKILTILLYSALLFLRDLNIKVVWETFSICLFNSLLSELTRKSLHQLRTAMHHQPPNQERAESICQSFRRLVRFPLLNQIKPQIPFLMVPFRQFF